jgi:hypothetical protein
MIHRSTADPANAVDACPSAEPGGASAVDAQRASVLAQELPAPEPCVGTSAHLADHAHYAGGPDISTHRKNAGAQSVRPTVCAETSGASGCTWKSHIIWSNPLWVAGAGQPVMSPCQRLLSWFERRLELHQSD